jgi:hypothetical protein
MKASIVTSYNIATLAEESALRSPNNRPTIRAYPETDSVGQSVGEKVMKKANGSGPRTINPDVVFR